VAGEKIVIADSFEFCCFYLFFSKQEENSLNLSSGLAFYRELELKLMK